MSELGGLLAVLVLVAANGYFVAAEFSLVAVRRSRVTELVAAARMNAKALERALDNLDANLAATQLGITVSSLGLGWIGEPAIAQLIEPPLAQLVGSLAGVSAYAIAIVISFFIITALHIVLGELAPKSLALQRSEATALWTVRPLGVFLWLLRPAILLLNGLGNLVLRVCGLRAGDRRRRRSIRPSELKLLVAESQDAGILQDAQEEVLVRALDIGSRRIGEIMTPRTDVDWIDANDAREDDRADAHGEQAHAAPRGTRQHRRAAWAWWRRRICSIRCWPAGNSIPWLCLASRCSSTTPCRSSKCSSSSSRRRCGWRWSSTSMAGSKGSSRKPTCSEALAGELPETEGETADVVERADGSLLIDGMAPAQGIFDRLGFKTRPANAKFHTIAGFALAELGRLPETGDGFTYEDWQFEVVDMDGRRIDKLLASA